MKMKKMTVKVFACVMVFVMMVSFAGCSNADFSESVPTGTVTEFDIGNSLEDLLPDATSETHRTFTYEEMIDSFVPDALNCFDLKVGESHKPQAALWLQGGSGEVYSSDENVVTVSALGKVTAVGEGEAYVVISIGSLFQVMRYTVTAE